MSPVQSSRCHCRAPRATWRLKWKEGRKRDSIHSIHPGTAPRGAPGLERAQSGMRGTVQPPWPKCCRVPSQGSAQAQGLLFPPAKSNFSRSLPLTPQRFPSVPLCPQHSTCSSHPAEKATKLQFFRTTVLAQEPQMSTLHWTGIYLSRATGGSHWRQPLQATSSREKGCVS